MKPRLPKLTGLFGATATLFALMASASAASLSVNFSSDREDAAFGAGETAGAPGYETSGWNDIASVLGDGDTAGVTSPFAGQLTDSNGEAIEGATVEWTTANSWNTTNGVSNGDNKLMNGYLDSSSNNPQATVSIAGLPSSFTDAGYTVVVYFGSDGNGRTGKVTVEGGETYSFSSFSEQAGDFPAAYVQTTDTGDGEPDANFAVWSGLSSADVNITVDRGSNNSGIHGFQIIGATPPPLLPVLALVSHLTAKMPRLVLAKLPVPPATRPVAGTILPASWGMELQMALRAHSLANLRIAMASPFKARPLSGPRRTPGTPRTG